LYKKKLRGIKHNGKKFYEFTTKLLLKELKREIKEKGFVDIVETNFLLCAHYGFKSESKEILNEFADFLISQIKLDFKAFNLLESEMILMIIMFAYIKSNNKQGQKELLKLLVDEGKYMYSISLRSFPEISNLSKKDSNKIKQVCLKKNDLKELVNILRYEFDINLVKEIHRRSLQDKELRNITLKSAYAIGDINLIEQIENKFLELNDYLPLFNLYTEIEDIDGLIKLKEKLRSSKDDPNLLRNSEIELKKYFIKKIEPSLKLISGPYSFCSVINISPMLSEDFIKRYLKNLPKKCKDLSKQKIWNDFFDKKCKERAVIECNDYSEKQLLNLVKGKTLGADLRNYQMLLKILGWFNNNCPKRKYFIAVWR